VLKSELFLLANNKDVLPGISEDSNMVSVVESPLISGHVRKANTARLVANTTQLVAVPDRTTNARKACTVLLAETDSTINRRNIKRSQGQVQG
jgi:hypothetical protein